MGAIERNGQRPFPGEVLDTRITSIMWCDECGLLDASANGHFTDENWQKRAEAHTQILAGSIRVFRNHRVLIIDNSLE